MSQTPNDTVTRLLAACDGTFTKSEISKVVDANGEFVVTSLLGSSVISGGEWQELVFTAAEGNWREGVQIFDADLQEVIPRTSDLMLGRWAFDTEPSTPLTLQGTTVDVYAAAADALDTMESSKADEVHSFSGQLGSFSVKAKGDTYAQLSKKYRGMSRIRAVSVYRDDVNL